MPFCISGQDNCPFDYIKIYDGKNEFSPVIGTFCGMGKFPYSIIGTSQDLFVEFVSSPAGELHIQPRDKSLADDARAQFRKRHILAEVHSARYFTRLNPHCVVVRPSNCLPTRCTTTHYKPIPCRAHRSELSRSLQFMIAVKDDVAIVLECVCSKVP